MLTAAAVSALIAATAGSPAQVTLRPDELKWEQPFGPRGMSLAFAVGKLGDKKPASYFIKFPAGLKTGWHIHTNDYEAVVLKGVITAQAIFIHCQQGADAQPMTAEGEPLPAAPGKR